MGKELAIMAPGGKSSRSRIGERDDVYVSSWLSLRWQFSVLLKSDS